MTNVGTGSVKTIIFCSKFKFYFTPRDSADIVLMGTEVSISSRIFAGLRALGVFNIVSVIWRRVVISCKIALRFHRKLPAWWCRAVHSLVRDHLPTTGFVWFLSTNPRRLLIVLLFNLFAVCASCVWKLMTWFGTVLPSAKSKAHSWRAWRDSWMKFRAFWLMKGYSKMKETLQTHNLITLDSVSCKSRLKYDGGQFYTRD